MTQRGTQVLTRLAAICGFLLLTAAAQPDPAGDAKEILGMSQMLASAALAEDRANHAEKAEQLHQAADSLKVESMLVADPELRRQLGPAKIYPFVTNPEYGVVVFQALGSARFLRLFDLRQQHGLLVAAPDPAPQAPPQGGLSAWTTATWLKLLGWVAGGLAALALVVALGRGAARVWALLRRRLYPSLRKAVRTQRVDLAEVSGNGGFFGLTLRLRNRLSIDQTVRVDAGDVYLDGTGVFQRMVVLGDAVLSLRGNQEVEFQLAAFCMDADKPAPPSRETEKRRAQLLELLRHTGLATGDNPTAEELEATLHRLRANPQMVQLFPEALAEPEYSLAALPRRQWRSIRKLERGTRRIEGSIAQRVKKAPQPAAESSFLPGFSYLDRFQLACCEAVAAAFELTSPPPATWGRAGLLLAVREIGRDVGAKLAPGIVQHALWSVTNGYRSAELRKWVTQVVGSARETAGHQISDEDAFAIVQAGVRTVLRAAGLKAEADGFR